jgi:hypothetical protein
MAIQSLNPNPTLTPTGVPVASSEPKPPTTATVQGIPNNPNPANSLEADQARAKNQGKVGYDIFGNPTIVSNSTITEKVNPQNLLDLEKYTRPNEMTGADGFQRKADGNVAVAPVGAIRQEDGTYTYNGKKYNSSEVASEDTTLAEIQKQKQSMYSGIDIQTARQIEAIENQFKVLRQQQEASNVAQEKARMKGLLMSGTARYAQTGGEDIMGAQITTGIQSIASLNAQEQSLIVSAQSAAEDKKYKLLDSIMTDVRKTRDEKIATAKEVNDKIIEEQKKQAEITKQINKENAIASLVDDNPNLTPAEILQELKRNGVDATIKDVTDTLSGIHPDAKAIQSLATKLGEYGVDNKIISQVLKSGSFNDALSIANPYMQDPKAKLELQTIVLDQKLKQAQIAKTNYELVLLKEYNGLSPKEYADKLKAEKKEIDDAKTEEEKARLQGLALKKKATLLGTVLDSSAIDSVVGPSVLSRSAGTASGIAKRVGASTLAGAVGGAGVGFVAGGVGALPGALIGAGTGLATGIGLALQGSKDYFTGASDALIGQTEQFISKEFIQNLIDVKAQGAVFGALQKAEQDALTASATYVGQRRVYSGKGEDKEIIGYDMSESDFRREFENIKNLTQKAYERATGKSFSEDESATIDSFLKYTGNGQETSSLDYYNK